MHIRAVGDIQLDVSEFAAKAQYYLGEIDYNRSNYPSAIHNFDLVLERYPAAKPELKGWVARLD